MFKIHKLFISESSYKTGNPYCLLNENLGFIGSVSMSVICVCVVFVSCVCMCFIYISMLCLCPCHMSVSCSCLVFVSVLHIYVCVYILYHVSVSHITCPFSCSCREEPWEVGGGRREEGSRRSSASWTCGKCLGMESSSSMPLATLSSLMTGASSFIPYKTELPTTWLTFLISNWFLSLTIVSSSVKL